MACRAWFTRRACLIPTEVVVVSAVLSAVCAALGVYGSVSLRQTTIQSNTGVVRAAFDFSADTVFQVISATINQTESTLYALASTMVTYGEGMSYTEFAAVSNTVLVTTWQSSLAWTPRIVGQQQRDALEHAMSEALHMNVTITGLNNGIWGGIHTRPEMPVYYPLVYVNPPPTSMQYVLYDLGSEGGMLAVLQQCSAAGTVTVSDPGLLVDISNPFSISLASYVVVPM